MGWGGMITFCFCTHAWCYATVMLLARAHMVDATQHLGWDGVGCGIILCTWPHGGCYAALGVGWDVITFFCTWTHGGWYATLGVEWGGMITFFAFAHMLDATPLRCCLHVQTWSMPRTPRFCVAINLSCDTSRSDSIRIDCSDVCEFVLSV